MRPVICLFLIFILLSCNAQVVINETSVKNLSQIRDKDGHCNSWIELYNTSSDDIRLGNYFLSDKKDNLQKWNFSPGELKGNSHLLIYADGKDIKEYLHWETKIYAEDEWRYFAPPIEVTPEWIKPNFVDTTWYLGKGGFGIFDNDDKTLIETSNSICLRKKFEVEKIENVAQLMLNIDYDDAFIAFLNGVEIARKNIGVPMEYTSNKTQPFVDMEARMYRGFNPEEILVEPSKWENLLVQGQNTFAVQVFNYGPQNTDLSIAPFLTLGLTSDSFQKNSVPQWWTKQEQTLHTNFKLKVGESLFLSDKKGNIIDSTTINKMPKDYVWARKKDGKDDWGKMYQGSPGETNNTKEMFDCITKTPKLNNPSGYYNESLVVFFENSFDGEVRYTINGAIPTQNDSIFPDHLLIEYSQIITIRAFDEKCEPGKSRSYTYFVNENHVLPVVSLIVDKDALWSIDKGIYITGKDAGNEYPYKGANYWKDWEVPAYFEYFDNKERLVNQQVGLKINGGGSRANKMKSFRLTARKKYGKSSIEYPFFKEKPELEKFKIILLKNAGQNFNATHITDLFAHRLHNKQKKLYTQAGQSCIVFVNGKYWGIQHLREKYGKNYLKENFGLSKDSIDILGSVGTIVMEGDATEYIRFRDFVRKNNMNDPINYMKVLNTLDIENFVDYHIAHFYSANRDCEREGNVKFWRSPDYNGNKWQYFLSDMDLTFGSFDKNKHDFDKLGYALGNVYLHYEMMRSLLKNRQFKKYFIERYCDLLNSLYSSENVTLILNEVWNEVNPEMPKHFERWPSNDYSYWQSHYRTQLENFIQNRPNSEFVHLQNAFNLGVKREVLLKIKTFSTKNKEQEETGGLVVWSSLELAQNFEGYYFEGMEIDMVAKPKNGYIFSHWEINGEELEGTGKEKNRFTYKIGYTNHVNAVFKKK